MDYDKLAEQFGGSVQTATSQGPSVNLDDLAKELGGTFEVAPKKQKGKIEPGIGSYLNPATLLDLAAGHLAGAFGAEEDKQKILQQAEERLKRSAETTPLETLKGVGAAGLDVIGGIPGMIGGAGVGLYEKFGKGKSTSEALEAGKQFAGEWTPSTLMGFDTTNPAYQGAMTPLQPIMQAPEAAGKVVGLGAEYAGASPETQKELAATTEALGLLGMTYVGGRGLVKATPKVVENLTKRFEAAKLKAQEETLSKQPEPVAPLEQPKVQEELPLTAEFTDVTLPSETQKNQFGFARKDLALDQIAKELGGEVTENIPYRRELSEEIQAEARGGDLFSEENIRAEAIRNAINKWEEPSVPSRDYLKQQEIEQAYAQKAQQERLQGPEEAIKEPEQFGQGQQPELQKPLELPQENIPQITIYGEPAAEVAPAVKITPRGKEIKLPPEEQPKTPEEAESFRLQQEDPVKTQEVRDTLKAETTKAKVIDKLVGKKAGEAAMVSQITPESLIETLKYTEDSKPQNLFEREFMSQGYMVAEASRNPAVQQTIRYLKGMYDRNAMNAERDLFAPERPADPMSSGVIPLMTKYEKLFNVDKMASLVKQLFEAKNNAEYKFNLDAEQQIAKNRITKLMDEMFQRTNENLPEGKRIEQMPNYIMSVHSGKFYGVAMATLPDGSLSKPVKFSLDNKYQAEAVQAKLASMGYKVSDIKTQGHMKNVFGDVNETRAANYQYMLDMLGDEAPEVRELYTRMSAEVQARATTTQGYQNRLKQYKGFVGEAGNRPWLTPKENYYDFKKALTDTVEAHYAWVSAQEAARFDKQIMKPENKIPPNNRDLISNYINNNIIGRRFASGFDNTVHALAEWMTGASPKQQKQVTGIVGNVSTMLMTSMGSAIHAIQNVVQPVTALVPQMLKVKGFHPVDMTNGLIKGAAEYAYVFGAKQVGEIAKVFGKEVAAEFGSKNFLEKQKYAEDNGIITPTIVDPTPLFGDKYLNRTHQFVSQGFLSKPTEQAARWTVFSTMTDFYRKNGMSKEEAFKKAHEVAQTYMVDYGPDAKANIWKSLGLMGNIMGRLQSFATNQFSQIYLYGKNAPRSINDAAAFAGYMGTIYALGGIAGLPGFDALEYMMNSIFSRGGETFSLRNYMRQTVGDEAYGGAWEVLGLGLAPSFGVRSIRTDTAIPLPAAVGIPVAGRVGEAVRTVARRAAGAAEIPIFDMKTGKIQRKKLFEDAPTWAEETESEKGRELQSISPVAARGRIEEKFLTDKVVDPKTGEVKTRYISPNTGKVLHTATSDETSFANVRSAERAKQSEISSEQFKESQRFQEQKKDLEKDINSLALDIYGRGKTSDMKEKRFANMVSKYVKNYTGDINSLTGNINNLIQGMQFDNADVAALVRLSQKPSQSMDDIRRILFHQKYMNLRNQ